MRFPRSMCGLSSGRKLGFTSELDIARGMLAEASVSYISRDRVPLGGYDPPSPESQSAHLPIELQKV